MWLAPRMVRRKTAIRRIRITPEGAVPVKTKVDAAGNMKPQIILINCVPRSLIFRTYYGKQLLTAAIYIIFSIIGLLRLPSFGMGNQPSTPVPGTKLQVIGAGLLRTGTASLSEALRILLDAPIYHSGTQVALGPPDEILSWINILTLPPARTDSERSDLRHQLQNRLDGYAAVTDSPAVQFLPELLEMYPDAIVVCTVRDRLAWQKSVQALDSTVSRWFLRVVLFPLPVMRHIVDFGSALRATFDRQYGWERPRTVQMYDRHLELVEKLVPADRLLLFDVRDGWGPLCKALGKEVPKDIPFPNINDGASIDRVAKKVVKKGLTRWMVIISTAAIASFAYRTLT